MKINPLPGWLIVRPVKIKQKETSFGIILPEKTAENIRFVLGLVVASHPKKYLGSTQIESQVKTGELVYFDEVSTRDFTWYEEKYFAIPEEKIYGTVELTEEEKHYLEFPQSEHNTN